MKKFLFLSSALVVTGPALAADLVRSEVSVIVTAGGTAPALAAKAASSTIPVVFTAGTDPVKIGLVDSLNRPGANVTGISMITVALAPKRLELLHELVPTASVMALLVNPSVPALAEPTTKELNAAARTLGLELHVLNASTEGDFDAVFAKLGQLRASGLVMATIHCLRAGANSLPR